MSAAPRSPVPREYEFTDDHKERFRALAASISFVGVCTMLFGALACLFMAGALYAGFVPHAIATAVLAALCLVTSFWMVSAGRSLSALVRTRGRDIEDLMEAVAQFQRLFGLVRIVIVIVSMLAVVGGGLVVWCTLVLDRGGKCLNPFG
jgi:hypothetical protein